MTSPLLHFDQFAAAALITAAWQAILLVFAAAAVLRLMPRLSAEARFTAWAAVFFILLALPFAPHSHASATLTRIHIGSQWTLAATLVWAALSSWRAVELARECRRLKWIVRRAHPLPLPSPAGPSNARSAQVCLSPDVLRPSVIGFFHPKILIPQDLFAQLTPEELDHILLHERHHLRRRDDWLNLLQKLALVLFPLNPALLWVERRLCFERELACDESVLAATNTPRSYARSLLSLAEHTLLTNKLALALGAWERRSELSRRIHRILDPQTAVLSSRAAVAALTLLCTGLLASAAALSRAPRLVSFANPAPSTLVSAEMGRPHFENRINTLPVSSSNASQPTLVPTILQSAPSPAPILVQSRGERLDRPALPRHRRSMASLIASDATPSQPHISAALSTGAQSTTVQSQLRTISTRNRVTRNPADRRAAWSATAHSRSLDAAPTILFAVFNSPSGSPTYAAVPTPGGWLVFQL